MATIHENTLWLPEMTEILKKSWIQGSSLEDHYKLVDVLNKKLDEIIELYKIEIPTYKCNNCDKLHKVEIHTTIQSMYGALKEFNCIENLEYNKLMKNFKECAEIYNT